MILTCCHVGACGQELRLYAERLTWSGQDMLANVTAELCKRLAEHGMTRYGLTNPILLK
jgi:hypothetical protein